MYDELHTLEGRCLPMGTKARVAQLPKCDIHKCQYGQDNVTATYDGRTTNGSWAYMCQSCYDSYGVGLGTGKGQLLVVTTD